MKRDETGKWMKEEKKQEGAEIMGRRADKAQEGSGKSVES